MWTQIRVLLQEQSDLGPPCLSIKLQIIQWTTKHTTFCDFALYWFINVSSVSIRSGLSLNARAFARLKKLINILPNNKLNLISLPRPDMNIKAAAFTVS